MVGEGHARAPVAAGSPASVSRSLAGKDDSVQRERRLPAERVGGPGQSCARWWKVDPQGIQISRESGSPGLRKVLATPIESRPRRTGGRGRCRLNGRCVGHGNPACVFDVWNVGFRPCRHLGCDWCRCHGRAATSRPSDSCIREVISPWRRLSVRPAVTGPRAGSDRRCRRTRSPGRRETFAVLRTIGVDDGGRPFRRGRPPPHPAVHAKARPAPGCDLVRAGPVRRGTRTAGCTSHGPLLRAARRVRVRGRSAAARHPCCRARRSGAEV
jgi:hypothetical protein